MKCINATALECIPRPRSKHLPHIRTFEDGSTKVMCDALDPDDPTKCTLKGICTYVDQEIGHVLEMPEMQEGETLADYVDRAERKAVEAALIKFEGDREKASQALDISPTVLWRKMTRLDIKYEKK